MALALAGALPACDAPVQECDGAFRSAEFEGVGEEPNDGPQPAVVGLGRGAPVINCPECGSHWTVAGGSSTIGGAITGGIVAVYLDAELGMSLLSLAEVGTFRHNGRRGQFRLSHRGPDDGYTLEVHPFSGFEDDSLDPQQLGLRTAVLTIEHENTPLVVWLQYVNNKSEEFEEPPDFD